jgi:hypothetical protein
MRRTAVLVIEDVEHPEAATDSTSVWVTGPTL